jgi:hypothetical protein
MKILVPVKRVIDYNVKPRVKADGTGVDLAAFWFDLGFWASFSQWSSVLCKLSLKKARHRFQRMCVT